jgi:hypothetical protein
LKDHLAKDFWFMETSKEACPLSFNIKDNKIKK